MTNRILWIDTAKGLGILLVIIGHLKTPYLASWIYTFHMPLFFILSGYVFPAGKYTFSDFLVKRLKSLVIPYFCLGAVIFIWFAGVYFFQDRPLIDYWIMLKNFIIQKHYWTIWFLAALFLAQLIYYCINHITKDNIAISTAISAAMAAIGFIWYRLGGHGLVWNLDVALIAQFFYHCGYILKKSSQFTQSFSYTSISKKIAIIVILLAANVLFAKLSIALSGQSLDMSIGIYGNEFCSIVAALSGSLAIIYLCSIIADSRALNWLGRNTMVIFSWHSRIGIVGLGFIYSYLGLFIEHSIWNQLIYSAVSLVAILAFFVPITLMIKKSPCHSFFGL